MVENSLCRQRAILQPGHRSNRRSRPRSEVQREAEEEGAPTDEAVEIRQVFRVDDLVLGADHVPREIEIVAVASRVGGEVHGGAAGEIAVVGRSRGELGEECSLEFC